MTASNLFIRCTHTGFYADGRDNNGSVLITDLDVGYENQLRKVPCYVPRWADPPTNSTAGHIDIPLSSRSMLSFDQGVIRKFVDAGVLTANLFLQPEVYDNAGRPSPTDYPIGTSVWNSDDNTLNWSDGTNWRDAAGNIT